MHCKGQPLVSFETVINLISATTTRSGLHIQAVLDERHYEKGITISDEELQQLCLRKHEQDPQWNYTLSPHSTVKSKK
jgi:hypothetical protein